MIVGTIIGTIAIVLITITVGLLVDRKHSIVPRPTKLAPEPKPPPPPHAAGEAPATAIRARQAQVANLRGQRCATCRASMTNTADDTVRYNERELLVLHFSCPACAHTSVLYIEPIA